MRQDLLIARLAWAAIILFALSWFLPVLDGVPGWMACRYALSLLWPYGADPASPAIGAEAPQVLSALTNVVFVAMAWFVVRLGVRPGLFVRVAIACFVLNLYWLVQAVRSEALADLKAGYYVWLAAFAIMIIIGALTHRTRESPAGTAPRRAA